MRGTDWQVTQWGRAITDSGNDEYTGLSIPPSDAPVRLKVYDDDGVFYADIIAKDERAAEEAHNWMMLNYGSTSSTIRKQGEIQYHPFM